MTIDTPSVYELIGLVWVAAKPGSDYLISCPNGCGAAIVGRHKCGRAFSECVCGACDLEECFDPNCPRLILKP